MKILIFPLIGILLIAGLGVFEHLYVNKKFDDFEAQIDNLIVLTTEQTTETEDIAKTEEWWSEFTNKLHIFTPHTIIKDIEFWLAEAKGFIETKSYDFALAKLKVVKAAAKNIPDSYSINFGNIF